MRDFTSASAEPLLWSTEPRYLNSSTISTASVLNCSSCVVLSVRDTTIALVLGTLIVRSYWLVTENRVFIAWTIFSLDVLSMAVSSANFSSFQLVVLDLVDLDPTKCIG